LKIRHEEMLKVAEKKLFKALDKIGAEGHFKKNEEAILEKKLLLFE